MKILLWGLGVDFNIIINNVVWKRDIEIIGFLESKKVKGIFEHEEKIYPIYAPYEIGLVKYDYIIISNYHFEECLLIAEKNGIDLEKIIVPYFNNIIDENLVVSKSEKCMENALEIIEKLNIQHDYSQKKRILLYGDNRYLWQFLCVSTCKKDVEIIGIVTTTHSIQGYIKVYGKETKIIESYEIKNISFDMMLILDENAPSIFTEISQVVNKSKMVIPFMTGIEENEYEIVVKLLPYIFEAENVVDTLSTLHSTGLQHPSGRQPQHMIYDLINYSLFNCMEYRKLGFPYPTIGRGPSDDYMRVRTLELLIDEIKRRNIEGNVAELGVYKGEFAKILRFYFPQKELYLYDTFEGFDDRDKINEKFTDEWMQIFKNTSLEKVQALVGKNNITHYRKGWFPESILDEEKEILFCFIRRRYVCSNF